MTGLLTGFRNKKGSFAVFAIMAFAAIIIVIFAAIKSAGIHAMDSVMTSFGRLWGKSILAEYDIYLKERYGILAYRGDEYSVEQKLEKYLNYSFEDKEYMDLGQVNCDLEGCSLLTTANLKEQIEKIVLGSIRPDKSEKGRTDEEQRPNNRYISSEWILKGLPSYGKTESTYLGGIINKIKAGVGINSISETMTTDKYILSFFKDYVDDRDLRETYFNCEVEYLISGKADDRRAKDDVAVKIKSVRNILNLFYLYSDAEKRDGAMALASVMTPGPAAVLTQGVILEIWAYAEAENDMNILYDNKTVPLLKKDSNWALSLDNVFGTEEQSEELPYVKPRQFDGENYTGYLRILLMGLSEETKLLRIMDLIQINMKFLYDESFLIGDYNSKVNYGVTVNKKKYEFSEKY